jgi:YD repeat-containing protein
MRKVISPASGMTDYTHDPAGNILTETDSASVTVTRTYDAVNRVLQETYPDSTQNATYTYDATTSTFGKGRLTRRVDPSGSTTFHYERRGLPNKEVRSTDSVTYTTTLKYDKNRNRISIKYPSGSTTYTYTFDVADRPKSIAGGGTPSIGITNALYKPFGPIVSWNYGNGRTETRSYDQRYQLTSQVVSGSILDRTYGHDGAGNLNSLIDNLASVNNRTFGYDDLNRLITANGPWGSGSFSYDAIGNRQTKVIASNTTNYNYNNGGVYLQSATGAEPATIRPMVLIKLPPMGRSFMATITGIT